MWKRVIRDYFAAFRREKLKEAAKTGNWWMYPYFALVLPACLQVFRDVQSTTAYFLVMIPILFSSFVLSVYPATLPKIMYLCPMSNSARKEYMEKSRVVRSAIAAGISLISITIVALLGVAEWIYLVAIFSNHCMFALVMSSIINENGHGTLDVNGKRVVDWDSKAGILEGCMLVIVMITAFIQASVEWEDTSLLEGSLLWAIPAVLELPIVVWFCRHWSENVERALCYETAVNIVDKKKD